MDYMSRYETRCSGPGRCSGCEECLVEVRRTSTHVARKSHHGLLEGDRYTRTTGFGYQKNGPRVGYMTPHVVRVGYGPLHPPVLVGCGFANPTFAVPAASRERAALTAWHAQVARRVNGHFWSVEEADNLVGQAQEVAQEVEAFVALHDPDGGLGLRVLMGVTNVGTLVTRALRNAQAAREMAAEKAQRRTSR